jgi:Ca2+/H+ antiporter
MAVLLIVAYELGVLFSLKTHRELFGSMTHSDEDPWLGYGYSESGQQGQATGLIASNVTWDRYP